MINKIAHFFVFACIVMLAACGSETATKPSKSTNETKATAQTSTSTIIEDPTTVSYTQEQADLMQRLNALLAESSKCEYVFYLPGYAMSTEIADPNQLRNFVYFVAAVPPARTDCDMEVGMAIRNKSTDEIHITIDAVVTKKECAYANVTFDGKTHKMSMTKPGYQHIMQFLNIKPGDGTPVAK